MSSALETENLDGLTVLHIAAAQAEDPLTLFQLVRWGADIQRIARPVENGWLEKKTGDTPLHFAARREDPDQVTRMFASLIALGAKANVYDNANNENPLEYPLGLQPIDYLSQSGNIAAMSLIAPGFSVCERIESGGEAVLSAVGLGGMGVGAAATGASVATGAAGITAVTHSSGAVILTGSGGYIAGTLGTLGTSALAVLTAPATLAAAGVTVVVSGGAVLYCRSER